MTFRCPYCYSDDIEVTESTQVEWGNNDQGTTLETFRCEKCFKTFMSNSMVEVVKRSITYDLVCPYCDCNDDVIADSQSEDIHWYFCESCKKFFAVRPEEWYGGKKGCVIR